MMLLLIIAFAVAVALKSEEWIGAIRIVLVLCLLLAIARLVVGRIVRRRRALQAGVR